MATSSPILVIGPIAVNPLPAMSLPGELRLSIRRATGRGPATQCRNPAILEMLSIPLIRPIPASSLRPTTMNSFLTDYLLTRLSTVRAKVLPYFSFLAKTCNIATHTPLKNAPWRQFAPVLNPKMAICPFRTIPMVQNSSTHAKFFSLSVGPLLPLSLVDMRPLFNENGAFSVRHSNC